MDGWHHLTLCSLLLLLLIASLGAEACTFSLGNNLYDLTPLTGATYTVVDALDNTTFYLGICGDLADSGASNDACPPSYTAVCRVPSPASGGFAQTIAEYPDETTLLAPPYEFLYEYAQTIGWPVATQILFVCNTSSAFSGGSGLVVLSNSMEGGVVLQWTTPYACNSTTTPSPSPPSGSTPTPTSPVAINGPVYTGYFSQSGTMLLARYSHTATNLLNGNVLIVGGVTNNGTAPLVQCEIYNPFTSTFSAAAPLDVGRWLHAANLLPSGGILVTGGTTDLTGAVGTNTAAVYNLTANVWAPAANTMSISRFFHTGTRLPNGLVLIVGGSQADFEVTSSVDLFNASTNSFSATNSLGIPRAGHQTIVLPTASGVSNFVLVVGGMGYAYSALPYCEVYNVAAGTWTNTPPLNVARYFFGIAMLSNGSIIVAGGLGTSDSTGLVSSEIFNPATYSWSLLSSALSSPSYSLNMVSIGGGKLVLAFGGTSSTPSGSPVVSSAVDTFYATSMQWAPNTDALNQARAQSVSILLADNKTVLVTGGFTSSMLILATSEIFNVYQGPMFTVGGIVGVLVALVAIIAIIAGSIYYYRNKKSRTSSKGSARAVEAPKSSSDNEARGQVANNESEPLLSS